MEKTTKELIEALSSGPARKYIADHQHDDIAEVILKNKEVLGIPASRLFDQIAARKKAKEKLPSYYANPAVIYPPPRNLEQSSSEKTARYKAAIIESLLEGKNGTGLDLTGGFGVDSYFFSTKVRTLHFVEPDVSLLEIARYNHQLLGAENIEYHTTTAEEFLNKAPGSFDFVYVDPSRRGESGKRVYSLGDSHPDILRLAPDILARSRVLLIKSSPLFDLQAGISQLPFVTHVWVVAADSEVRELLFLCERDSVKEPVIEAVKLQDDGNKETFAFTFDEEKTSPIEFSDPLTYIYEPNASILKAGAFKTLATRFGLKKIQVNTHLYTSDTLVAAFPGRKFIVESVVKPDPKKLKKFFPSGKANVATRNYPLTPDALKRKTGLKDGGEKFLLGFSGVRKKFVVVVRKL